MKVRSAYQSASAFPALRPWAQSAIAEAFASTFRTARLWLSRRRERKALLRLDDHMLRDIGLDCLQAEQMAARPFWRA
jgi:uncharacterized protein YjiS (DUF1127 family)